MKLLLLSLLLAALGGGPGAKTTRPGRPAARAVALAPAAFCRQHDLAPLWALNAASGAPQTLLGCMGPRRRRLDLVYETVRRDARNPALYHVRGKSRERDRIMPFTGTIRITGLQRLPAPPTVPDNGALAHYQATGQLTLRENPAEEGSGRIVGKVLMTFSRTRAGLTYAPTGGEAWGYQPGEGSRFTGSWTSAAHPAPVALVWATNFLDIADSIIEQFHTGDRGRHISRRYAAVGWDRYWENDEWWAEEAAPLL